MLTVAMYQHLLKPVRHMAWLAWFERPTGPDLYVWSGSHHMTYDGNLYRGYGYLSSIQAIKKADGTQHIEQVFNLNGLDPSILGGLNTSVRGLRARLWLGGIGPDRQVIVSPLLFSDLEQDTLGWDYSRDDNSVTLRLVTFDALPLVGRVDGGKWSHESQLAKYGNDVGFRDNATIALQGPPIVWTAVTP